LLDLISAALLFLITRHGHLKQIRRLVSTIMKIELYIIYL